jgi:hypothetical protein
MLWTNFAPARKWGHWARDSVNVFAAIDADFACTELRDQERGSAHGLLEVDHGGIVQLPVRMHHQCDRDEESKQPCAPSRVVANGNAEAKAMTPDSGTNRLASGTPKFRGMLNAFRGAVSRRGGDEDPREEDSANEVEMAHERNS